MLMQPQVLLDSSYLEDDLLQPGICPQSFGDRNKLRCFQGVLLPVPEQGTLPGGHDIAVPIDTCTVRQRNDETVTKRPCDNRRRVFVTGTTPNMFYYGVNGYAMASNTEYNRVQPSLVKTAYAIAQLFPLHRSARGEATSPLQIKSTEEGEAFASVVFNTPLLKE